MPNKFIDDNSSETTGPYSPGDSSYKTVVENNERSKKYYHKMSANIDNLYGKLTKLNLKRLVRKFTNGKPTTPAIQEACATVLDSLIPLYSILCRQHGNSVDFIVLLKDLVDKLEAEHLDKMNAKVPDDGNDLDSSYISLGNFMGSPIKKIEDEATPANDVHSLASPLDWLDENPVPVQPSLSCMEVKSYSTNCGYNYQQVVPPPEVSKYYQRPLIAGGVPASIFQPSLFHPTIQPPNFSSGYQQSYSRQYYGSSPVTATTDEQFFSSFIPKSPLKPPAPIVDPDSDYRIILQCLTEDEGVKPKLPRPTTPTSTPPPVKRSPFTPPRPSYLPRPAVIVKREYDIKELPNKTLLHPSVVVKRECDIEEMSNKKLLCSSVLVKRERNMEELLPNKKRRIVFP